MTGRRRAAIIGASGGIGDALAQTLEQRGDQVTRLSRRDDGLDLTDETLVEAALAPLNEPFDLIIVATGILSGSAGPEKSLRAIDATEMATQFAVNTIGPALVLKHAKRLLPRTTPAVFAALSARVGSIGANQLGGWYSYRASKAALNQVIKTASIELARSHGKLACVALHPGTVETNFTRNYRDHDAVTPAQAAANLLAVVEEISAADTGKFFDWAGQEIEW